MPEPAVPTPVTSVSPAGPSNGHANGTSNGHAGGGAASPSVLRRAILVHLRRTGPSAPDAIAVAIGASRSGVAQQLRALDTAGLVTRTSVRHGVGRPRHLYDITADAQDLFPSNYDGLATGLLAAILEVGGDSLVEDVFDLSAMTTGTFPVTRVRANVAAVVRDVVREAEGLARTRGVSLRWEGPPEAEAWVDAVAIRRALTNLVVNAIEHAGGAVAVTLAVTPTTLTVAVRDNGPGIAPGELKRLFRPFERGRTAEARGAGLGLAITLGLVEVHGGTLSAQANADRGSTFTVTLPAGMVPLEATE